MTYPKPPGCVCPPSYVRDQCNGHPEPSCRFYGVFGLELQRAHALAFADAAEQRFDRTAYGEQMVLAVDR